jgi:predicted nucleotidyltransferase component of viral defense system
MIPQATLQKIANAKKVRDKQIEKDYILSWVLHGLSQESFLKNNLVFKGGTALKKFYFQDYRFSEDLDFTLIDSSIKPEEIISKCKQIFSYIKEKSNISLEIKDDELSKHGDLRFFIDYIGPLRGGIGSRDVKVDITYGEIIINETQSLLMFNEYEDLASLDTTLQVYSLKEVFIEKLCALIDRTQPRDLYDIWHLLENQNIVVEEEWTNFLQKAKSKNINEPNILNSIEKKEATLEKMWDTYLAHQMNDLPYFKEVIRSVKRYFR